jgi:signal-transduction protein with cAMP-binding, CBS, and nucleotidyltransferase domain
MSYEWIENRACVATYKILEGDKFLDQFEAGDIPFEQAALVPLSQLRYFPKTTPTPEAMDALSAEVAKKFINAVVNIFTVRKQNTSKAITTASELVAKVFADGNMTIKDVAEVVQEKITFPAED